MTINEFISYPEKNTIGFTAKTIYASVGGTGDGTSGNPYSISDAFANLSAATTLILKDGDYTNTACVFNQNGNSNNRIVIKSENPLGAKVGASSHFQVNGANITFQDLQIYSHYYNTSVTDRFLQTTHPSDFIVYGVGTKFTGCIIHDFGNIGNWESAVGAIFENSLIINIGRGNGSQGHSMYIQNLSGTKYLRRCILSVNYDSAFVLHQYGSGLADLVGCIYQYSTFINGRNLMGSAATKVLDTEFNNNTIFNGNLEIGLLGASDKEHEVVTNDNKGFDCFYNIKKAGVLEQKRNRIIPSAGNNTNSRSNITTADITDNEYVFYGDPPSYNKFFADTVGYASLAALQSAKGWETNSSEEIINGTGLVPDDEQGVVLFDGGCIVNIVNYSESSSVNVDLTGLPNGNYRAYNAQNHAEYFDFTYAGGNRAFAMTGWTKSIPLATDGGAMNQDAKPIMFPRFGVFYVRSI